MRRALRYAGWLAVQATLRIQFAMTIALGVSLAEMFDAPAMRYGLLVGTHLMPKEYHKWLPVISACADHERPPPAARVRGSGRRRMVRTEAIR